MLINAHVIVVVEHITDEVGWLGNLGEDLVLVFPYTKTNHDGNYNRHD